MLIGLAFKAFFSILSSGTIPDEMLKDLKLRRELGPAKEEIRKPEPELNARAVQLLALFQRDARLVDFLREDIKQYPDAQVGAAVRSLHENCRQVLERYIQLEPVISSQEGQTVTVQDGFNPSSIKLLGNVIGKPPLKGTLRHHGWRAVKVELPSLLDTGDQLVVAPAEVEIP
jgi:hypothetical protein